jgi:hypothetical protein
MFQERICKGYARRPEKVTDNRISRTDKREIAGDKSADGDIMQRWCHRIVSAGGR